MQKYGKSNTQNEIFFEVFWNGVIVNMMGEEFFFGDDGTGDGGGKNAAGVHGGRDEGWGQGRSPGHGGFLVAVTRQHTEQRDGVNGRNGANGRDGCMQLIDSGLA